MEIPNAQTSRAHQRRPHRMVSCALFLERVHCLLKGLVVLLKRLDNGKRAKPSVKKGDIVVYGKYAGTNVEIKGVEHLILRETELLGVIVG